MPHSQRCLEKSLLLFFTLLCCRGIAQEAPSSFAILNYIRENLPQSGVLKISDGLIYVAVDEGYIHKLVGFIQKDGFEEPPYFGNSGLVGAHITVVTPDECKAYGIGTVQECGKMICFTPKTCQVVHPPRLLEIDEVYLVTVEAPELDLIREKVGLPKREYDFHITVGFKKRGNHMENTLPPLSELAHSVNVGDIYEHYKKMRYRILAVARHSESLEELVVYQALYGERDVWVRTLPMFLENVSIKGGSQPRFKRVETSSSFKSCL
jgi:hypothetical protein